MAWVSIQGSPAWHPVARETRQMALSGGQMEKSLGNAVQWAACSLHAGMRSLSLKVESEKRPPPVPSPENRSSANGTKVAGVAQPCRRDFHTVSITCPQPPGGSLALGPLQERHLYISVTSLRPSPIEHLPSVVWNLTLPFCTFKCVTERESVATTYLQGGPSISHLQAWTPICSRPPHDE